MEIEIINKKQEINEMGNKQRTKDNMFRTM